jgi:hypothetical protein
VGHWWAVVNTEKHFFCFIKSGEFTDKLNYLYLIKIAIIFMELEE